MPVLGGGGAGSWVIMPFPLISSFYKLCEVSSWWFSCQLKWIIFRPSSYSHNPTLNHSDHYRMSPIFLLCSFLFFLFWESEKWFLFIPFLLFLFRSFCLLYFSDFSFWIFYMSNPIMLLASIIIYCGSLQLTSYTPQCSILPLWALNQYVQLCWFFLRLLQGISVLGVCSKFILKVHYSVFSISVKIIIYSDLWIICALIIFLFLCLSLLLNIL